MEIGVKSERAKRGDMTPDDPRAGIRPADGGMGIVRAARNSLRGVREAAATEAAVRQELAVTALAVPLSFVIATNAWIWLAMVASLLFVLAVEFLNTALERLCNHVTPQPNEAIGITKDLASAAVMFALLIAGLVWIVALLDRLGAFD